MALIDTFGRTIRYLRISVTDRCNMRCDYCRPSVEPMLPDHAALLTLEEIARLARLFVGLGVERFRLTGGEPLLRRNLLSLARELGAMPGLTELSLTTNALLLARFAHDLRAAGVRRVNISLDSLTPEIFARITRGGDLAQVLAGIDAALEAGLAPVKVNMVVMRGVNAHEIPAMIRFAARRGVVLRFIETMPIGDAGSLFPERFISAGEILGIAREAFGQDPLPAEPGVGVGAGPARYFRIEGTGAEVGVIAARSRHFCDTCNRMRLTSRGGLVLCLGAMDVVDLKTPLRAGASDEALMAMIRAAVAMKPARHHFDETVPLPSPTLNMVSVGG
ncbi:MAG: GTP 3',8-cyclase MoaA [Magnetococcales bacterium]|nr:GTP 3',8-cyclase MoaA [Magnetococcales bacterium]